MAGAIERRSGLFRSGYEYAPDDLEMKSDAMGCEFDCLKSGAYIGHVTRAFTKDHYKEYYSFVVEIKEGYVREMLLLATAVVLFSSNRGN